MIINEELNFDLISDHSFFTLFCLDECLPVISHINVIDINKLKQAVHIENNFKISN